MTRYNDKIDLGEYDLDAYRAGVDRVLEYLEPLDAYPEALLIELRWAIEDGMI